MLNTVVQLDRGSSVDQADIIPPVVVWVVVSVDNILDDVIVLTTLAQVNGPSVDNEGVTTIEEK